MPGLTAHNGTDATASAHKPGTRSQRAKTTRTGAGSRSLLPTDDDEKKSLTVGRYQFRKDGAGWECREIVGKGVKRKRPYLAHLSRAGYEKMRGKTTSQEELEQELIEWADKRRAEKHGT
jgi:hypothetical protein